MMFNKLYLINYIFFLNYLIKFFVIVNKLLNFNKSLLLILKISFIFENNL